MNNKNLSRLPIPEWEDRAGNTGSRDTYYPRSISLEDIDKAIYEWFSNTDIVLDGREVPVFFLDREKWGEFKKSWKYMDGDRNTEYPYITIRRSQNPRLNQSHIKGRIPGKTFTTKTMLTYTNDGPTYTHYKVPEPIKIELDYEIRILTHYIEDINIINETFLRHFASLQVYLDIDKHYMSMAIENVSDESDLDNQEDERLIHTLYSIVVDGYLIDKIEFEEHRGITKVLVKIEEETN